MAMIFGLAGLGLDTMDIAQAQDGCFGMGGAWKALTGEVPAPGSFRQLFLSGLAFREYRDATRGQKLVSIGQQGCQGGKRASGNGGKRGEFREFYSAGMHAYHGELQLGACFDQKSGLALV